MASTLTASAMLKSAAVLGRDLASKLRVSVAVGTSDTDDETSLRDEAASSMAFNIKMTKHILTHESSLAALKGFGVHFLSFLVS